MAQVHSLLIGMAKTCSDQPRSNTLHSREARQSGIRDSTQVLNSIFSRHQGDKVGKKDLRSPGGITDKDSIKVVKEAGTAINNPDYSATYKQAAFSIPNKKAACPSFLI